MSRMLNLVEELLSRSRRFQQFGRHDEAFNLLSRLAEFRELPVRAAEVVDARLGEIYLRRRKYKRARRHLARALRFQPCNARYHYLLAKALIGGNRPETERALEHYRRSLALEPQPKRLCAYGLLLVILGLSKEGLRHLRRAVEAAPENVAILRRVIKGMRLANHGDEARRLLLAARFRNPRDRRLLAVWSDLQFQQLRKDQQTSRQRMAKDSVQTSVLLPFIRPEGGPARMRRPRIVRQDGPSSTPPPRSPLRVRRPGQRHVQ